VTVPCVQIDELTDHEIEAAAWRPHFYIERLHEEPRIIDEHFEVNRQDGHCLW
jgi:hypothetical protein